jgi:hypothetical protein
MEGSRSAFGKGTLFAVLFLLFLMWFCVANASAVVRLCPVSKGGDVLLVLEVCVVCGESDGPDNKGERTTPTSFFLGESKGGSATARRRGSSLSSFGWSLTRVRESLTEAHKRNLYETRHHHPRVL